jgi:5-methylcytosine-specific restriction endonuclease McrA
LLYACSSCGKVTPNRKCPDHQPDPNAHWSPTRDRAKQASFRRRVLNRDGHRCVDCGSTDDLRACHLIPLSQGGGYNTDEGVTRCGDCDRRTDPYAR